MCPSDLPGAPASVSSTAASAEPASSGAWRADLAAAEDRLRAEFRQLGASHEAPARPVVERASVDKETIASVRSLVAESERRQQRELALRVAEVFKDVQAQRQADLVKIERNLGLLQNTTGIEVARQREMINSLAVRVSQR